MRIRSASAGLFLCGAVCIFGHARATKDDPDVLLKPALKMLPAVIPLGCSILREFPPHFPPSAR
jgi:hypothetical protein